jgi:type VI secretion system protein ImpH
MATQKRQPDSAIEDRLFAEFRQFSFFEAVHLLESMMPGKERLGASLEPSNEPVRFSVPPGLSFPPCEISDLQRGSEDGLPAEMSVTFMGLLGPSGVLPYWYNELALERLRQKDTALTAFLNLFNHRLISLFYRAWLKHRFPENYREGGSDRLTTYLLSLCGLGTPGLLDRVGFMPETLSFYTGIIAMPAPTAAGIEATVGYLSGADANVEQFVERMIPISPEDQTRLGAANSSLGVDALCGGYIWECETKFRIALGPMGLKQYKKFLPGGPMLAPIFSFTRSMVGIEYEFDLKIILKQEEVPLCEIGGDSRLGLTTWLRSPGSAMKEVAFVTFEEGSFKG